MKLQDELEAEHCEDIASQVEKYRAMLLKKMDEKLGDVEENKERRRKEKQRRR